MNFIKVFNDLKNIGVKNIVDFNTGYLTTSDLYRYYFTIEKMKHYPTLRKLL